jgi:3-dehydroquinate dehydratase-2
LNGPNLNLLGEREPEIYGRQTLEELNTELAQQALSLNVDTRIFQSASESELISTLQNHRGWLDGILINPGAFTHTSIALRDTLLAVNKPCVEVHLSDLSQRESFRRFSYFSDIAKKTFMGEGPQSYAKGLYFLIEILRRSSIRSD